jgi:hypothetical protein
MIGIALIEYLSIFHAHLKRTRIIISTFSLLKTALGTGASKTGGLDFK